MTVEYTVQGPVAVITLNNPPVNDLGLPTRQALTDALARAHADTRVNAILITGAGEDVARNNFPNLLRRIWARCIKASRL